MKGAGAAKKGMVVLLLAVAGLAALAHVAAVGAMLNKAAAVLAGAEARRAAFAVAQDVVWQVDEGLVAETGEQQTGAWSVAWRKSWNEEVQGWRICVTVAGVWLGRSWVTQLTTFR